MVLKTEISLYLIDYKWCPGPESNRHALSGEGF
jgi:hypothetical protein